MDYIAMLRGINVSGQKKILMNDLRQLLISLGYGHIRTYIQSGNIVFKSGDSNHAEIEKAIEEKIRGAYGFEVPVMIRSKAQIQEVLDENPFLLQGDIDQRKLHASFLATTPNLSLIKELDGVKFPPDAFYISKSVVYVYCPKGYGRTKFTNTFFEKKLGVAVTTRNWKTVAKLAAMANEV